MSAKINRTGEFDLTVKQSNTHQSPIRPISQDSGVSLDAPDELVLSYDVNNFTEQFPSRETVLKLSSGYIADTPKSELVRAQCDNGKNDALRSEPKLQFLSGHNFNINRSASDEEKETNNPVKYACFKLADKLTNGCVSWALLISVGILTPLLFMGTMYVVGWPQIDMKIDSFRMNSHPAAKNRMLLQELFRQTKDNSWKFFHRTRRENGLDDEESSSVEQFPQPDWPSNGSNPGTNNAPSSSEEPIEREETDSLEFDLTSINRSTVKRQTEASELSPFAQRMISKVLYIYYTSKDGTQNMLDPENLEKIHRFENVLVRQRAFKRNCFRFIYRLYSEYTSLINKCYPPFSVNGYFYPTPYRAETMNGSVVLDEDFAFDGLGTEMTDYNESFEMMKTEDNFYTFFDNEFNGTLRHSSYLRSTVLLGIPSSSFYRYNDEDSREQFEYILSLEKLMDEAEEKYDFEISYFCELLTEHLVDKVIRNDITKTAVSLSIIAVLVFVFTGCSPWLTFWALIVLMGAVVDNLFLYYVVFGIEKIGMLNAASGIILVAIGVDDVLVYVNIFRGLDPNMNSGKRLGKTIYSAASSTFLTSATTTIAFAGNIVSPIPAVKSFSLFMSTLVLTCWVLVLLIVPPALSIWTSDLPLYRNYLALKAKFFRRNYKRFNRNCFAKITENNSGYPSQTNLQYEDSKPEEPSKCYLTCSDLVKKFTNLVVKFRFFLLAIWAIVIVIALIGISNLEIKSGVPKVFSGDNRLERAIGLRQQNAYVSDEIFYRSNALTRTSTMFREKNFKTTPAQLTLIRSEYVNDPKKTVRRVGWYRRREPVDVECVV